MTIASGTATRVELVNLYDAAQKLSLALRYVKFAQGSSAPVGTNLGNYTAAQLDALVTAVSGAITAVNA